MGKRLHYIDIAKGLLILMVVWGHYELICRLCYGISDPTINKLDSVENLWVAFFMPAFFFITGFCTNFSKPFRQFMMAGIKTLLIPAVIINYGANIIEYVAWGWGPPAIAKTIVKSFILTCAGEWFIPSLFISRIIVYGLVKLKTRLIQVLLAFLMLILGVYLYNSCENIPDIWYFKHALMVVPFMIGGLYMKQIIINGDKYLKINSLLYAILITVILLSGTGVPYVTNRVDVELWQIPELILLALTGTLMILFISDKIKANKILEYLGRNSLVIYLSHFFFYRLYIYLVLPLFNQSVISSLCIFFGVIIANIASCCLISYLLNTRYLKWILGKF